jgi:hypothetical protein
MGGSGYLFLPRVNGDRYGSLRCHTETPGAQGGRPSAEYWLNEAPAR